MPSILGREAVLNQQTRFAWRFRSGQFLADCQCSRQAWLLSSNQGRRLMEISLSHTPKHASLGSKEGYWAVEGA